VTSPPSATPTGTLRISLPIALGHRQVLPVIESFLESWPAVTAEVSFTDRFVDLVDEGFDIAVRVGEPKPDSRLIAHTVATQKLLTWSRLGLGQVKQETLRSALPNNFFDEWILTTVSGLNHERLRRQVNANRNTAPLALWREAYAAMPDDVGRSYSWEPALCISRSCAGCRRCEYH
jgi:DNA-binding transcriptional LysR family regulator